MKKLIFSSIVALALLSSCGNTTEKPNTDTATAPKPASADVQAPANNNQLAAVKYQCPMKCEGEKTYDKPGKCPMCQMDMKEVK